MSTQIVRKPIAFNVDDAHQRELLEWCGSRTNNFSGFVKSVLFAFMTNTAVDGSTVQVIALPTFTGIGDIL